MPNEYLWSSIHEIPSMHSGRSDIRPESSLLNVTDMGRGVSDMSADSMLDSGISDMRVRTTVEHSRHVMQVDSTLICVSDESDAKLPRDISVTLSDSRHSVILSLHQQRRRAVSQEESTIPSCNSQITTRSYLDTVADSSLLTLSVQRSLMETIRSQAR